MVMKVNQRTFFNKATIKNLLEILQTWTTVNVYNNADTDLLLSTGVAQSTKAKVKHVAGTIVNVPVLTSSATGAAVEVGAEGTDTDIDVQATTKGAGKFRILGNLWKKAAADLTAYLGTTALASFAIKYVAAAVNYIQVTPSATGTDTDVGAIGTDTDISITITPKGAGLLKLTSAVRLKAYATSSVPSASAMGAGSLIYVSDGNAGAKTLAMSDGTNWKVIALGASIASS